MHPIFEKMSDFVLSVFDSRQAFIRAKVVSDFIGVITRVALVKTVDDYVQIRPSGHDVFSQLIYYAHPILYALFILMMGNIFIILFGFTRKYASADSLPLNSGSFFQVLMLTMMLFLPVTLFINEGSRMANELVQVKSVQRPSK